MKEYEPDFEIIEPPRLDKNGVTVVYKLKEGERCKANFSADTWENDKWLDKLEKMVAKRYAELENQKEKQGMDMEVTKIENKQFENERIDVSSKVKKHKEKLADKEKGKSVDVSSSTEGGK